MCYDEMCAAAQLFIGCNIVRAPACVLELKYWSYSFAATVPLGTADTVVDTVVETVVETEVVDVVDTATHFR